MLEDKLPKIDTGQIKEEGDGRDREREWNYKNNNHHTTNVSLEHVYKIIISLHHAHHTNHLIPPVKDVSFFTSN